MNCSREHLTAKLRFGVADKLIVFIDEKYISSYKLTNQKINKYTLVVEEHARAQ